jgi:hypothetical protein
VCGHSVQDNGRLEQGRGAQATFWSAR